MSFIIRALFFITVAVASVLSSSGSTLRYITTTDGLTFGSVTVIMQDPGGMMRFGTIDGLNLFDGRRLFRFSENIIGHELKGSMVSALATTDDGSTWVQTTEGLHRYRAFDDLFEFYRDFSESKGKSEHSLMYSSGNRLYLLAPDGLIYYFEDGFTDGFQVLQGIDFSPSGIVGIDWSDSEEIVIFCRDSLMVFDLHRTDGRYTPVGSKVVYDADISDCFSDGDNMWIVDSSGKLQSYNPSINAFTTVADLSDEIVRRNVVTDVCADRHGNILVGFKSEGVLKISGGGKTIEDTGIRSAIFDMVHDRYQDIIWIGTDGQGVIQWINDTYSIYTCMYSDLLHSIFAPIRSIYLDKTDNSLYLGTKGDGILRISDFSSYHAVRPQQLQFINTRNTSLSGNSVYVMKPSMRQLVWIGSEGGLDYMRNDDRRIRRIGNAPEYLKYIHAIIEENENVLWAATTGLGIFRLVIEDSPEGLQVSSYDYYSHPGGISNYFFTLMRGVDGNIYAGNRGEGVFRISEKGLERFETGTNNDSVPVNNEVFALEMTPDSTLWIGTSNGLLRHNADGTEALYNSDTGFPSSYIHSMHFDGENLWLATNAGLIRFVPENGTFQVYGKHNGVDMVEFSDGAFFESGENLFFGGNNGFVVAARNNEVRSDPRSYHPPLYFTRLLVNGAMTAFHNHFIEKNNGIPKISLHHDENNISIGLSVPEYINSANLELFYRMNDDVDWIKASDYMATFNRLAPGRYELQAKYRDTVTGYESPVSVMGLEVAPPWYLSGIARIVYIILLILFITYFFQRLKRKERQRRQRQIEKIEWEHNDQLYEQKLRFFTNITHEFSSPLTLIYGPCERLLSYEHSDNYVCRYVGLIKQNAERLNSLIQEVIDFRRLETGHRERNVDTIDITVLSTQILASFEHLAEQNSLTMQSDIALHMHFETDGSAFTKIFYNLVSNAFKYTPVSGSIKVTVVIEGDELVLSVYNTGKGITPDDRKRIFNRYELLDTLEVNATKGLSARNGLGLAICQSMVHFLDGSIDINSEPGKYAEFVVRLPRLEKTAPNPASPDIVIPDSQSVIDMQADKNPAKITPLQDRDDKESKGRILVVDDDREMLILLQEGLDQYSVVTATSADDAMAQMRDRLPDLVITDVMMPDRDGMSLISEIKTNVITSSIPVIVLSAKHTNDDQVAGLRAGADAYVPKPFTFSYLSAVIERLMTPNRNVNPSSPAHFSYDRSKLQHYDDMKLVDDVVRYIEEHLQDEKLTAAAIADGLGIGLRKLYRRFQQLEPPSPSDMIREIRIASALNLMLTTTLSMKEIITQCGYRNRGSFYKTFMKKYGMPPIAYREALTSRKIEEPDDDSDIGYEESGDIETEG